jgi:hypothetical protein
MAKIHLSRFDAERKGRLPPTCIRCGRPATAEVVRQFGAPRADFDNLLVFRPFRSILGILWLFAGLSWMANLFRTSARGMMVRLPFCDLHKPGWFRGIGIRAASMTDEAIVLGGVSEEFVTALARHRAANHDGWRQEVSEFEQLTDGPDFFQASPS